MSFLTTSSVHRTLVLAAFGSALLAAPPQQPQDAPLLIEIADVVWDPDEGRVSYQVINHSDRRAFYWSVYYNAVYADGRESGLVHGQEFAMTNPDIPWEKGRGPLLPGESRLLSMPQDRQASDVEVTPYAVILEGGQSFGDARDIEVTFEHRVHKQFARRHWAARLRQAIEEAVDDEDLRRRVRLMHSSLQNGSDRYVEAELSSAHKSARSEEESLAEQWGYLLDSGDSDLGRRVAAKLAELESALVITAKHLPKTAVR